MTKQNLGLVSPTPNTHDVVPQPQVTENTMPADIPTPVKSEEEQEIAAINNQAVYVAKAARLQAEAIAAAKAFNLRIAERLSRASSRAAAMSSKLQQWLSKAGQFKHPANQNHFIVPIISVCNEGIVEGKQVDEAVINKIIAEGLKKYHEQVDVVVVSTGRLQASDDMSAITQATLDKYNNQHMQLDENRGQEISNLLRAAKTLVDLKANWIGRYISSFTNNGTIGTINAARTGNYVMKSNSRK